MDIRHAYLRRSKKRARLQKRVAVAALFAVAGCTAFLLQHEAKRLDRDAATAAMPAVPPALLRVAADTAPAAARRVYPYSIVPGGVTDRIEVARAVMADKVVAAHYAGFAVDKASLRTIPRARAVYVSYRKGDKVYWTARRVTLTEGESVLSDGRNDIRARCGNRISDTPRLPVEVKGPDERELDTPVEQAQDGDGAVQTVAFGLDEQDGGGQRFVLPPIPNGAGLLAAAQPQPSFGQVSLDSLFDSDRRLTSLPSLWSPIDAAGRRTASVESATGSGGTSGSTSGTTTKDPGNKPTGGDPGTQPTPAPPPDLRTDPAPSGTIPAKTHDLPDPGGLWLSGVAAAALLLQRRLRSRRRR